MTQAEARDIVKSGLMLMCDTMARGVDETTHGVIAPPTIQTVASALVVMYNDPCPYNLSTLRQAIMALK